MGNCQTRDGGELGEKGKRRWPEIDQTVVREGAPATLLEE